MGDDMTTRSRNRAPSDDAEVSFFGIINALLRNRRLLIWLPTITALVLATWSILQPEVYRATADFLPRATGSPGGGMLNIAREFGVNVGAERPSESPEFYAELLRSREILKRAVLSEYQPPAAGGGVDLLAWYGVEPPREDRRPRWVSGLGVLRENVGVSVQSSTGIVRFSVSDRDPAMAEQVAARLLELVDEFNLETRRSRALEEGRFASERLAEVSKELAEAEAALKGFLEQNRAYSQSPELAFENDRLQREVYMRQELYTSLLQSREQARIEAARDMPLVIVVASPEGSARQQGLGTIAWAIIGLALGGLLAVAIAFARDLGRAAREEQYPQYEEFIRLRRDALDDLRDAIRIIRPGS